MLKYVVAFAVGMVLAACASFPTQDARDVAAWEYLCYEDRTFDCTGVDMPEVVRHDGITGYLRAYGFFFPGEDIVFVQGEDQKDKGKAAQTLVHEMAHYLQDQSGWSKHNVASCKWEESAFAISDRWAVRHDRPDLVRGEDWWKPYANCQHYGD